MENMDQEENTDNFDTTEFENIFAMDDLTTEVEKAHDDLNQDIKIAKKNSDVKYYEKISALATDITDEAFAYYIKMPTMTVNESIAEIVAAYFKPEKYWTPDVKVNQGVKTDKYLITKKLNAVEKVKDMPKFDNNGNKIMTEEEERDYKILQETLTEEEIELYLRIMEEEERKNSVMANCFANALKDVTQMAKALAKDVGRYFSSAQNFKSLQRPYGSSISSGNRNISPYVYDLADIDYDYGNFDDDDVDDEQVTIDNYRKTGAVPRRLLQHRNEIPTVHTSLKKFEKPKSPIDKNLPGPSGIKKPAVYKGDSNPPDHDSD